MALQVPRGPTTVQRMENCCEGDALASWSVSLNRPTQQSKGKQKGEAPGGHPAAHPFPGPAGLSNFYQTPLSTPRVVSPGSSGEGSICLCVQIRATSPLLPSTHLLLPTQQFPSLLHVSAIFPSLLDDFHNTQTCIYLSHLKNKQKNPSLWSPLSSPDTLHLSVAWTEELWCNLLMSLDFSSPILS